MNLSSNLKIQKDTIRLQFVYGEGIQNYMNDATVDVGLGAPTGDPVTPVEGETIPLIGIVAFYDRTWNDKWTSTAGYSMLDMDNTEGQSDDAFKTGQYAARQSAPLPRAERHAGTRAPVGPAGELQGRLDRR